MSQSLAGAVLLGNVSAGYGIEAWAVKFVPLGGTDWAGSVLL